MRYRALVLTLLLAAPMSLQAKDTRPSLEQRVQRMVD
jgi:hypothetical protein